MTSYNAYISAFQQSDTIHSLANIGRGIERETLRVLPEGRLSAEPHKASLGSALTHPLITTDYAENLLEFITPVSTSPEKTIEQLKDIQKFTLSQIDNELLWPMSMPCFVNDQNQVPLAQYGQSNIGKMKTVYRQGLKNRYGSMMQVIAGIHFNFSFPESFWRTLQKVDNYTGDSQTYISEGYFTLLRNYKRLCWLIPYLYGSSPAICPSFLQGKTPNLPFEKSKNGYLYLPYATSLRMSDLGYTNSEQSQLSICYNTLDNYVASVEKAMTLSSDKFAALGVKVDGEYQQLNTNVLQIENELYAPIRPKRVTQSGEKPSEALKNRGVEYIEVRALDVNPFVDTGISVEQVYFLDIFLTYCALAGNPELMEEEQCGYEKNMDKVVVRGREPGLILVDNCVEKTIPQWGNELFDEMLPIAELLDQANATNKYTLALATERKKLVEPSLTPSATLLSRIVDNGQSLTGMALESAAKYRDDIINRDYAHFNEQYFSDSVAQSHLEQQNIEENDVVGFEQFLENYFS